MNAAERPCLLHRILALAAALLLLSGLFLSPALGLHAQAEEISSTQKLRVGYYAYTGFNMIDADGSYSGYSYELLQKIARYRNVIYEYDGYDSDVNDVMQMLEDGEENDRVVCDYIAGMTDQYALAKYSEYFMPKSWQVY